MATLKKITTEKIIKKLYDTAEKRVKTLKKKGNIITFKTPFMCKGESYIQIGVERLKVEKMGHVKLKDLLGIHLGLIL